MPISFALGCLKIPGDVLPSVRRLLLKIKVERAKRRRRCYRSRHHEIAAGDLCMVVAVDLDRKNYCVACAAAMLELARREISELGGELGATRPRATGATSL